MNLFLTITMSLLSICKRCSCPNEWTQDNWECPTMRVGTYVKRVMMEGNCLYVKNLL